MAVSNITAASYKAIICKPKMAVCHSTVIEKLDCKQNLTGALVALSHIHTGCKVV